MLIKIGIIIDNIAKAGGTERAISSLCNGLMRFYPEHYDITIISLFSKKNDQPFFELHPAIQIQHLEKTNDFKWWNKISWYKKLVADLRQINTENAFDVLLGTTYVHNILLPLMVSNSNTKSVGCEHVVYHYPPKVFQTIRKFVYPQLDAVIVLNKTEQEHFRFLNNTAVIPNSLPFENDQSATLNAKKIINAGRLTHEKGVDLLIDMYENIYRQAPDWELNIYGDGEDFEALQSKIKQKGLEPYIKLCGSVKNISESYLQSSGFCVKFTFRKFWHRDYRSHESRIAGDFV